MVIGALLILLGVVHLANGVWMVAAPEAWYAAVPGVAATGPANIHFIIDIGLAFAASGTGLIWGARKGAAAFALAGSAFPALHAGFHALGWLHHGLPSDLQALFSELVAVFAVSALGLALAIVRVREEGGV